MLLGALCSSLMNGVVRYVSDDLHPFEIAFFRNFFGLVVLIPLFLRTSLIPGLVRAAGANLARQVPGAALFEVGRVFRRGEGETPVVERDAVAVLPSNPRLMRPPLGAVSFP